MTADPRQITTPTGQTRYVCDKCRWTYATKAEAANCECPSLQEIV